MSSTPLSSPTKGGPVRGSTGSPRSNRSQRASKMEPEILVPVTEEFYRPHLYPLTFLRALGYLSVAFYLLLVFLCKKTQNLNSPFYTSFMAFHDRVTEFYLVLLDLYKRCPAVTGVVKKLRFEVPYFMKLLSLYVPRYERSIMYLNTFNTLNNWLSLFVILTFAFLLELLVTVVDNIVLSVRSRNSEQYCVNMVHPSKFHDKSFTQDQLNLLMLSREYIDLKNSRHGLGPEAWNWQLRKTLKGSTRYPKSQDTNTTEHDSDSSL